MSTTEIMALIDSHPELTDYYEDKIDIISYYRGLIGNTTSSLITDNDIKYFFAHAKACDLNPFKNEIILVPFKNKTDGTIKVSYITTISGLRIIAQRTGLYRGQTIPLFCGKSQEWYEAWIYDEPPIACKVGVYRYDCTEPIYYVAKFKEYTTGLGNWLTKPCIMLQKCAEAGAIRKAFPESAGLYTEEEMDIYKPQNSAHGNKSKANPLPKIDLNELRQQAIDLAATKILNVNSYKDLTQTEAFDKIVEKINNADEKTIQHIRQGLDKLQPLEQTENRESEIKITNENQD